MSDFTRKLVVAIVLLAMLATVLIVALSLGSYDWRRKHAKQTSALTPIATERDGCARITVVSRIVEIIAAHESTSA
jgi:hypothetical protein